MRFTSLIITGLMLTAGLVAQSNVAGKQSEVNDIRAILMDRSGRKSNPTRFEVAIRRAVKYPELVPELLAVLDVPQDRESGLAGIHLTTAESEYPAVWALIQIGEPAIPGILRVLRVEDSDSTRANNAIMVLKGMYRFKKDKASKILEDAIAEETDSKAKNRLDVARAKLQPLKK